AALVFAAFPRPRAVAAGLAVLSGLLVAPESVARGPLGGLPFGSAYVARRACAFVARERPALGPLRLFNEYAWGGYLGWIEGPGARVFGDGRYLFQGQIAELQDALSSPRAFADFASRRALDGFLIERRRFDVPTTRVYPDGTTRAFARPWYTSYLPRARWALVYWDERALVFVDRAKVPKAWLAAHEYRWLLPGDEAARADALARGEIPRAALAAEEARHAREVPARR
ncbi:MAG: hypothetical protein KGM24_08175, partial [Elusimicrobia bacterium]|nr:hypothetical protein [Elusimicrobiota bacterium]